MFKLNRQNCKPAGLPTLSAGLLLRLPVLLGLLDYIREINSVEPNSLSYINCLRNSSLFHTFIGTRLHVEKHIEHTSPHIINTTVVILHAYKHYSLQLSPMQDGQSTSEYSECPQRDDRSNQQNHLDAPMMLSRSPTMILSLILPGLALYTSL